MVPEDEDRGPAGDAHQREVAAQLQVLTEAVRRLDERLEGISMTLEEVRLLVGGFQDDRRLP